MIFFVCVSDKIPAKFCHAGATVNLHNTLCSDPSLLRSLCRREAGKKKRRKRAGHDGKGKRERIPSSHRPQRAVYFFLRKIVVVCDVQPKN